MPVGAEPADAPWRDHRPAVQTLGRSAASLIHSPGVRDTAMWTAEDGEERVAAIERRGANKHGSYVWRTLRKENWCARCDRTLLPGTEALGYDWETRWCIPCAVETFDFVYWDTPEQRAARDAQRAELMRRVAEALDVPGA